MSRSSERPAPQAPAADVPAAPDAAVPDESGAFSAEPPLLPGSTRDDTDDGWGERTGGYDDEHYLAERPPHHDAD